MKILIVAATYKEIEQTKNYFKISAQDKENLFSGNYLKNNISFLITGIGVYSTIYELTKILSSKKFDIIINAGIAGSFDDNIEIGNVFNVVSEQIGDLGINDNGIFKSAFDKNFLNPNSFPFSNQKLINPNKDLFKLLSETQNVDALTVNTASGEKNKIKELKKKFNVQIESMEGAAFFYVCLKENVNFLEIRSVSNFVVPRCEENWQIMKAINNLNEILRLLIFEVMSKN